MAYMVYQQYTAAIKDGYRGRDVTNDAATAEAFRKWLEGLKIDAGIRSTLVEQARTIEDAFQDLVREAAKG